MDEIEVTVEDGKYTFRFDPTEDHRIRVDRYDHGWLSIDQGSGAVLALMQEVIELRQKVSELQNDNFFLESRCTKAGLI